MDDGQEVVAQVSANNTTAVHEQRFVEGEHLQTSEFLQMNEHLRWYFTDSILLQPSKPQSFLPARFERHQQHFTVRWWCQEYSSESRPDPCPYNRSRH